MTPEETIEFNRLQLKFVKTDIERLKYKKQNKLLLRRIGEVAQLDIKEVRECLQLRPTEFIHSINYIELLPEDYD